LQVAAVADQLRLALVAYHQEMTAVVLVAQVLEMMEQTVLAAAERVAILVTAAQAVMLVVLDRVEMGLAAAVQVVMQSSVRHLFLAAAGLAFLDRVLVVHGPAVAVAVAVTA
jgi:hypothetical protein